MATRGFNVPCILCGHSDGSVLVNLSDTSTFHCNECAEDFSADDVQTYVAQWSAVLAWIQLAPTAE